ncbi:MAG: PHP domain-containing protein [Acidobacteria bacterium]|nr:PHP domain-containing protein [Acidobacteriota bacterium]
MYIPLRVHSVYSKGRGSLTLKEMADWCRGQKLPAAALSDDKNLYGWAEWKRRAAETSVAPLFGCEIEIGEKVFLFLVKNTVGYHNLMDILNSGEWKTTEGLVTIFIPRPGEEDDLRKLPPSSSGDFYLGVDFFNYRHCREAAETFHVPLVWAHPLKFVSHPERLILLHAMNKKIPFPPERDRLKRKVGIFGPHQEALAKKKFGPEVEDVFQRTFEVAETCRFVFEGIVPSLPEDLFDTTLRAVVLEKSGFAPYFLVVHDVVEYARRNGILHNLKGSGASSFLAYLLNISLINPVTFDLYFARFLNKGRPDPPDFDLDFDSGKRDRVLTYVLERYGSGRTGAAFVCSLKDFGARSALYETARAFGLSPDESRSLSKKASYFAKPDALAGEKPLPGYAEIYRLAAGLNDVFREHSLHVGGVILTPAPVERYLPLTQSAKGYRMSHYDRDTVEDLKLIKLDLLSVRGLAAISETKKKLNIRSISDGDKKTLCRLKEAHTIGCFQVESPAMMNLLRRMKVDGIFDLTQALALIRPGPTESGMKEAFLRSREGRPVARDTFLEKVLPETHGLLLYEEQVMQIAERVAGMPADEGDLLRRSLKRKGAPPELKARFFKEADERGYGTGEIRKLWKVMEEFSSYSFNKAHSASYAHMAYQAVYLKTHHPVPYMAAVLNAGGGYYGPAAYIEEIRRMGIPILGPDINRSGCRFEVEGGGIRVGLTTIKGLAVKTVVRILEERSKGPFESVEDALFRLSLSKSELFMLIKSGVFDSLEPRRTAQILRYFRGLEGVGDMADMDAKEKAKMTIESLGFSPDMDSLALFGGKRSSLRIKDLDNFVGREVVLVARVVDARFKRVNNGAGRRYFFLFEDETGLLEGTGERKCRTFGSPPACCLRGEVRRDGNGRPKVHNCTFLEI